MRPDTQTIHFIDNIMIINYIKFFFKKMAYAYFKRPYFF